MKLNSLELKSFRSFSSVSVPLNARRVMIGGVNNAGKTSIREAIRWVLTGKAQGLDGRGGGTEVLVPDYGGASVVQAGLAIDGIGMAIRTWSPGTGGSLAVDHMAGSSTEQQQALYDKLRTTEAYLQAVLDTETFLQLDHANAKALLMGLLNVRVSLVLEANGVAEVLTLDELEVAYQIKFGERKVAKKALAGFQMPQAPVTASYAPIPDIDARLTELRTELDAKQRAIGGAVVTRAKVLERQTWLKSHVPEPYVGGDFETLDAVNEAIENTEERLAMMEQDAIAEDINEAIAPLQEGHEAVTTMNVPLFKTRIEALTKHQPKKGCVLDPEVPCDTTKAKFTNRAKMLQKDLDALPLPSAPVAVEPKKPNPLTEARLRLEEYKAIAEKFRDSNKEQFDHAQAITDNDRDLASLPNIAADETAIAALKERIQKGEGIRAAAVAYTKALETVAQADTQRKKLVDEVNRLEALVEQLGPQGLRVEALGQATTAFEDAINGYLKAFDYTVWFVFDPAWAVMINGRRLDTYSRSERYRIGIALQLAIAQMSGLDFAIVDELDMLTSVNREAVARILHFSTIGQIIVIGSREPEVALPVLEGLICHRVGMDAKHSAVVESTGVPVGV
jgi:hypothetical protein